MLLSLATLHSPHCYPVVYNMAKGEKRRLGFLSRKVTDLESTVRHQQETIRTLAAALQHQAYSNQLILSVFHTQNEHALGKLTPHEPTPSFQFTVPAAPARPEPGHDLTECPDAGGVLLAPPSAHGHYAREICRTVSNVAAEQAVTHGPATPAATTDADVEAGMRTSSYDSFMDDSEPPPTTTDFNTHYPTISTPPPPPVESEEDDTLRQLHESLNDISYITENDDTPSLGSSSGADDNGNDSCFTDSDDTPSLETSSEDDDYNNGPTNSTKDGQHEETEPEQPQEHNSNANTKPDKGTSALLQAAVRCLIEEFEQKEWTSLIDEQRCHHVMVHRFLRYTAEEDRQRDIHCNNTMFQRLVISQSSEPPPPCYYARAVVNHMGW